MTRQVTDNLYIDLGYFTPEDYYTYEANALAQLNTSAAVSCDGDVICDFVAAISSAATFECTADGGAVKDFTAALSSSASQTAVAVKTVDAVAPLGNAFSSSMTVSALRITEVTLVSEAFFVTDFDRNRAVDVTLSTIITQSLQNDRIRSFNLATSAAVSLSAQADVIRNTSSQLNSQFTQTALAQKTTNSTLTLNTAFSQTVIGFRVNRNVGDATVNTGGLYGNLEFDPTIKKFGSHSLKFLENNSNQNEPYLDYAYTGSKIFALRPTGSTYYNYGYSETSNGTTWTSGSTDMVYDATLSVEKVQYLNSRLVAWDNGKSTFFYSSTNGGTTWTKHTASGFTTDTQVNDIVYSGTHYIRVGSNSNNRGTITRSTDLVTWTAGSYTSGAASGNTNDIGAVTRTTRFTDAIVSGSTIATVATINRVDTGAADNNYLLYSTDHGANWTGVTTIASLGLLGIGYNGSNLWVVVGRNGDIYTSSTINGTYTKRTSGVTTTLNKVSFTNNLWIAVGDSNVLLTSTNGTTWTQRTVSFTGVSTPFYANSRWWVNDGSGYLYSSADGTTWTSNRSDIQDSLPSGANVVFNDSADWNSWKTIDFWVYVPTRNDSTNFYPLIIEGLSDTYEYSWRMRLTAQSTGVQPSLFYRDTGGTIGGDAPPVNQTGAYNQWNHIRVVNDGGRISHYINGTRIDTATGFTNQYFDGLGLAIYAEGPSCDVRIDELLISDAALVDPTATSFSVPVAEYTNNDNTDLLLHFNNTYADDNLAPPRTVSAVAPLNSQFTQTALAGLVGTLSAQLNTQATVSCQAITVKDATAQLNTQASVSAIPTRIFDLGQVQFDVIATEMTVAAKVGNTLVSINGAFSQATVGNLTTENIVTSNSAFTQSADFDRIRSTPVTVNTAVTQTTVAEKTAVFDSQQNTEFTQNTVIDRTRSFSQTSLGEFTQTVDASVVIESGLVDFYSDVVVDVDADAVRNANILMETLATKLTVAGYIGDVIVNMNSAATMTVDADSTSGAVAVLNSEFAASATALRIKQLAATTNSNSNLAVSAEIITVGASTQQAAFTQSTDIARTRGFTVPTNIEFTQTAQAVKTTTNTIVTHSEFTQSVDGDKTATGLSLEPVISSVTAQAVVIRSAQSQQNSQATLAAESEVGLIGEAALASAFTLTATPAKTAQFIVFEPVLAQTTVTGNAIRNNSSQQSAQFTATTSANRLLGTTVSITALYSQLTVGSEVNSAQAQLTSAFTMTVDAKLIVLDPELTYRVPKETRSYKIVEELRSYKIIKELRSYEIADN